jgi:SAM-dependent methyltransferase
MTLSAEERFYQRHYSDALEIFDDGASFERASQIRGHRYFCLHREIRDPRQKAALECGVGSHNICAYLSRFFGSYSAIDIGAPKLKEGDRKEALTFNLIRHNLNEPWPFPASQFDVVLAMMVFEHLFDPFFSFSEMSRVLRPGGIALVNLPIVTSIKNRVRLLFGRLPLTSTPDWWKMEEWDGGHLHLFSIPSIKNLCAKYDMQVARLYACGQLPRLKEVWPSGLCGEISFVIRKSPAKR